MFHPSHFGAILWAEIYTMIVSRYCPVKATPGSGPTFCFPAALAVCEREVSWIAEIGPGRGDFLFHLAEQHPGAIVCGIEIKRKRFEKLVARREKRALYNVQLVLGDARTVLPLLVGPIDRIYIQFPDPWPKRRHAKHRLLDAEFLAHCDHRLRPGGELWFVTDHQPYAETVAALVRQATPWHAVFAAPVVTECPEAYPTFFAEKWRNEGRTIYYQRYRKDGSG